MIVTRFPPEPNGCLHIGHAKAIIANFDIAREFGGEFHLRFDDTNPVTSKVEFIQPIIDDIKWLLSGD
jgi:glutaminyl-tRNA synthetase